MPCCAWGYCGRAALFAMDASQVGGVECAVWLVAITLCFRPDVGDAYRWAFHKGPLGVGYGSVKSDQAVPT